MATKVLFLVPYPARHAPSQRFRVELYERYLNAAGIEYKIAPFMDETTWDILYKGGSAIQKGIGIIKGYFKRWKTVLFDVPRYNYVFIHREAAPLGPPIFEWIVSKLWAKKMIFDFDDAIWIPNTSVENKIAAWFKAFWKVQYTCRWSYKISAGNSFLSSYASQYNPNTVLVPTCVDVELYHNQQKEHHTGNVLVGWTGSQSTLFYLDSLIPILQELQQELEFTFMVIANKDPHLPLKNYTFTPWSESTEVIDLLQMDIGVMPLAADAWSEGKCGFKLIQYLSLGIPAVASPIGVNQKIIDNDINGYLVNNSEEWMVALKKLICDAQLRKKMGAAGRAKIVQQYSIQAQKQKFIDLFS
ncbi:MAG: glycosyltransferase [Bacteroidota bacterium]